MDKWTEGGREGMEKGRGGRGGRECLGMRGEEEARREDHPLVGTLHNYMDVYQYQPCAGPHAARVRKTVKEVECVCGLTACKARPLTGAVQGGAGHAHSG